MNPLLTGQLGSRPVLPLRDADRRREQPAGSGAWPARGVPASRSIPALACVEHFDAELASFRTIEAQIAAARWRAPPLTGQSTSPIQKLYFCFAKNRARAASLSLAGSG